MRLGPDFFVLSFGIGLLVNPQEDCCPLGCSDFAFFDKYDDPDPGECSSGPKGWEYEKNFFLVQPFFVDLFALFAKCNFLPKFHKFITKARMNGLSSKFPQMSLKAFVNN